MRLTYVCLGAVIIGLLEAGATTSVVELLPLQEDATDSQRASGTHRERLATR
ncbi:hypothetical protein GCM10009792_18600 [Microcella alkalica]|uniref:Uncharacterized protein n=1 Tax=Microcella alkalica TaxID=355930 RepID=A0A839EEB8_9MICO|nr:hypothetical protein [Microcella alkalica]MBA8848752.1 hypothetical protein [Microcella alkalica]